MSAFDNRELQKYKYEAEEKWGNTNAYKEHAEKTKCYSEEKWQNLGNGMNDILKEFAECMQNGAESNSADAQSLVQKLQNHITENYYTCTNEILAGLGQMYISDDRFKNNIDTYSVGTAKFISHAIEYYCK